MPISYTPINKDLVTIGGLSLKGMLKEVTVERNKLWKDAERNMAGEVRATLIGVFPKLKLTFREAMSLSELSPVCNVLDRDQFSVSYFDPKTQAIRTADYYASDYALELLDKARGLYRSFEVSLVPIRRES